MPIWMLDAACDLPASPRSPSILNVCAAAALISLCVSRRAPLSWALSQKLVTVTWPVKVPPICLELVLGTRVCAVRVDTVTAFMGTVRRMGRFLCHSALGHRSMACVMWCGPALLGVGAGARGPGHLPALPASGGERWEPAPGCLAPVQLAAPAVACLCLSHTIHMPAVRRPPCRR